MSLTTITGTSSTPAGDPRFGTLVRAWVVYGSVGIDDDMGNVLEDRATSDKDGHWSLRLRPNSELTPVGSWYRIRIGDRVVTKLVPAGGGTYDIEDPALAFTPSTGVALAADLVDYQRLAERNAASGYMGLGSDGIAAWAQLPASLLTVSNNQAPYTYAAAYGVVGDGSAYDTAALQNVINVVAPTANAGVPALTIILPPGTFKITQLTLNRKAVVFVGQGVGNPSAYTSNRPSLGTTFQWGGGTGGYMFWLEDCTYVRFRNILFQGNTTNVPTAFVRCYSNGGGSGINQRIFFEGCHFGGWPWSNVSTPFGTLCATNGVIYDGTNANNDKFTFRDCSFENVGTGINIVNSQSEWGLIDNCYFQQCSVSAITTSANVTIKNGRYQQCAVDVTINSTGHVSGEHWSENSGKAAVLNGQGSYTVTGGMILLSPSMGTNIFEHNSCGADGSLSLNNLFINDVAGTYAGKKIYVRGASGAATMGTVNIQACAGITAAMLDIQAAAAGAGIRVFIKSGDLDYNSILKSSAVLTTSYKSQVGGMGFWTPGDQGFLAWSYDPTPAATSQLLGTNGTLRGVKIKVPSACTISNLHLWIGTLATAASMSNSYAALYSSAGALLAQSADQSAAWASGATSGLQTIAITPQAVSAGYVYVCWWGTTSGTMPTFLALTTGTGDMNLQPVDYRFFTADTGLTTTGPSTLGTKSFLSQHNWAAVS